MSSQQFAIISVEQLVNAQNISYTAFRIFGLMNAMRDFKTNIYDKGLSLLAKQVGSDKSYTSKCIDQLIEQNYVEVVGKKDGDSRRIMYKVVVPQYNNTDEIVVPQYNKVVVPEYNHLGDSGNPVGDSCTPVPQIVVPQYHPLHIADNSKEQLCDFVYDEALAIAGQKWAIVGKEQTIIDAINANPKLTDDNAIDFIRATADKAQVFKGFITFLADDPSTRKKPVVVEYDKDGYHPSPFIPNAQPKVEESPEEVEAARKAAVEHARQVMQAKKMELV